MKINFISKLIPAVFLSACVTIPPAPLHWRIDPVSLYDSDYQKGTETISVQQSSLRAALSNFETGEVDLLDISQPKSIKRVSRFSLGLVEGEELTSVAFHPTLDLFAAVIDKGVSPGRLEIRSASTGALVDRQIVGFGPDAVVFSPDGNFAVIANEGEDFLFEPSSLQFFTPEGSISIIRFNSSGHITHHKNIELANMTFHEGITVTGDGIFMERSIDWNGNGVIEKELDFDKNGKIEKKKVHLGYFEGHDVFGNENKGERRILIPIKTYSPALMEPEYIAISPDASKAYVTLQEDDAVAVVDTLNEQVISYFGLGTTQHRTDKTYEGWIKFDQTMKGRREPDGIATSGNGRFFITADEGDTDTDGSNPDDGQAISGGRSVSVFDAKTGLFLGDTGNQLDEAAFKNNVYPDRRSNKKGSEPEMLVSFEMDDIPLIAVGMERADAVELISLADPAHPKVEAVSKIAGDEDTSPEGIAHFVVQDGHYILTANETTGTVECFKVMHH